MRRYITMERHIYSENRDANFGYQRAELKLNALSTDAQVVNDGQWNYSSSSSCRIYGDANQSIKSLCTMEMPCKNSSQSRQTRYILSRSTSKLTEKEAKNDSMNAEEPIALRTRGASKTKKPPSLQTLVSSSQKSDIEIKVTLK
uniref:Uncharacterized protein n=1 Tax=Loa loa TaxID=7209 RepID=A0A1I7VYB0_LOALO